MTDKEETKLFDCYYPSDTLDLLVAYFPVEKIFYLNSKEVSKEVICETIENSIRLNKGVKHYYHPESNFIYMISIQREIEKCYRQKIDEYSVEKFGSKYESLDSLQKATIDEILTYRIISK